MSGRQITEQMTDRLSSWWTGALGQTSFNLLYGERLVASPFGSYYVLSATQQAVSVAVSYAFQVVSLGRMSLRFHAEL